MVALELGPHASERRQRSVVVEGEPDHVLLFSLRVRLGAYSAKLLNGIKHLCSGLSQALQCGDDVFLIFVTGYPPARGGMPQRIIASSVPLSALRITGAG
jgi:hypothetical protein